MNILIIGGTQGIGLELAKQALAAGHRVTIFARNPEKTSFAHHNLRFEKGDASHPEDVQKAVAGHDVIVSTLGIGPTRKPVDIFSQSTRNTVAALRGEGGPGRKTLIHVTGIGAGESRGHGGFLYDRIVQPLLLKTAYQDKDREERLLKESGLDWIIVRPGFLTNGPRKGKYRVLTDLRGVKAGKISRADVAGFILEQSQKRDYVGKAPLLTY